MNKKKCTRQLLLESYESRLESQKKKKKLENNQPNLGKTETK